MNTIEHHRVSTRWVDREKLRDKGQFWTPSWVAEAMIAYVQRDADEVFDPGTGMGVFYSALKKLFPKKRFYGTDIDPDIISQARREAILDDDARIEIRDFITHPPKKRFKAIVANPPYIRHHRISLAQKSYFQKISLLNLGSTIDGRAGLHIYFLIQALSLLEKKGRLAFIMSSDTCEGVFSQKLWNWISKKFRIEGIITFDPSATPFPGVDTNAIILLISNEKPAQKMVWARCLSSTSEELRQFLGNNLKREKYNSIKIYERDLKEALSIGLSRFPNNNYDARFTLADFARVMRGIATGANEFFFLTKKQARESGIPDQFLLPAVGRTRDAKGAYLTVEVLQELEEKGRPTNLFFPNGSQWEDMPKSVQAYIQKGEQLGLAKRALISTRRPWYKMEVREVPPFLFAYLGRRNARFIKNDIGIVPLTGFLCVYPLSSKREYIEKLWKILQHPDTISNLQLVGKSYGSGAIKVEPRSLEKLPISSQLIKKLGLQSFKLQQSLL